MVGYLGDGINDAPPLHAADVGISVDNGTDVARAAADVVLLQPSLATIAQGVREGRRTFANTLKYIRMGISSNFGNMLSMAGAAVFPALPADAAEPDPAEQPDLRRVANGDPDRRHRPGDRGRAGAAGTSAGSSDSCSSSVRSARSSTILTFAFLLSILHASETEFHTGWFVESLATQVLVIFAIRTRRSPFWHSRPSRPLMAAAAAAIVVTILLTVLPFGGVLGFAPLPLPFWIALATFVVLYLMLVEIVKRRIYRMPASS